MGSYSIYYCIVCLDLQLIMEKPINPQLIFNCSSKLEDCNIQLANNESSVNKKITYTAKALLYGELKLCDSFDDVLVIKNYYRIKSKRCPISKMLLDATDDFINLLTK